MTVNEFVRRIQTKASMLSTGDIPIKFNGKDIECVIELIENGKGYYINVKQPTKDLIPLINRLCEAILFDWKDKAELAWKIQGQIKEDNK